MKERKISVDTALGKLCACVGGDPNYPEIFVYIERPDGVEIDLVAAEVDVETCMASAYLYGDTSTEEWTKKHSWSECEINISCD